MGGDESHDPAVDPRLRSKGDESERILQDAFLTGGRDITGAGKLSAGRMADAVHDSGPQVFAKDPSWGSRAEAEGAPGEGGAKGLWHRFTHLFTG